MILTDSPEFWLGINIKLTRNDNDMWREPNYQGALRGHDGYVILVVRIVSGVEQHNRNKSDDESNIASTARKGGLVVVFCSLSLSKCGYPLRMWLAVRWKGKAHDELNEFRLE